MWRDDVKKILMTAVIVSGLSLIAAVASAQEKIAEFDTAWKLFGPNHKVEITAYDDPNISGVTCHVSKSVAGGITGAVGIATEANEASIACRQVGPVDWNQVVAAGDTPEVFSESRSILFRELKVARAIDETRRTIVYLVYTTELIDGSPKNVISTVPVMPWNSAPLDAE